MIKKVVYGLAILLVLVGAAVYASNSQPADSIQVADTTVVASTSTADTTVAPVQETASTKLVPSKKTFSFSFVGLMRGLLGMLVLIAIAYAFSSNRKAVSWSVVGIGLLIQVALAFAILQFAPVQYFFDIVGKMFVKVLDSLRRVPISFSKDSLIPASLDLCLHSKCCQPLSSLAR